LDHFDEHLDDEKRSKRPCWLLQQTPPAFDLGRHALRIGADVQIHLLEALTADVPLVHRAQKGILHPDAQQLLQLTVRLPGFGCADQLDQRGLQSTGA
jgi:hypothetical protein